jgi:hypothetical protein
MVSRSCSTSGTCRETVTVVLTLWLISIILMTVLTAWYIFCFLFTLYRLKLFFFNFSGVRVAWSSVFCVTFCRLLFVLMPLYCLFVFDLRLLITPLVSVDHCVVCPLIYGFWLPLCIVCSSHVTPYSKCHHIVTFWWSEIFCSSFIRLNKRFVSLNTY